MSEYNIRNGLTYLYNKEEPLYRFGYGLSYTRFDYSGLTLSAGSIARNVSAMVEEEVKNTGNREDHEIVQLYVQYPQLKVVRPLKELKGFSRVSLKPGETKKVAVPLKAEALAWWNDKTNQWEVEEGPVNILVGASSADIRLQKLLQIGNRK